MKKIITALILVFTLVFTGIFPLSASAYRINEYEMHHEAGMVINLDTDTVIYEKNADKRIYPAAITNLMTALVLTDNVSDMENTKITFTSSALYQVLGTGLVTLNLQVGEEISAKDALAALLVSSCGDAAFAIAEHVGGSTENFAEMMNKKAKEMGLNNTHFTNPIGLHSEEHYSTARELCALAKAAFEVDIIKELASTDRIQLGATNMSKERYIVTANSLINYTSDAYYRYAEAGKTGYTDQAGRCVVSTASYNGYNYLAIVLNAAFPDGRRADFTDITNMFRWAFNNFEYKTVFDKTTPVAEADVILSNDTDFFTVRFEDGLKALLPKDADASTLEYEIKLNSDPFEAPIKKGQRVGTADIYYANEKIGTLNLVAAQDVDSAGLSVFLKSVGDFFTSKGVKTVVIVLVVIIALVVAVLVGWILLLNYGKKRDRKVKYRPLSKKERKEWDENKD